MKKKNVVLLLGRGTEGCGVTKFTLEQNRWLTENGYTTTIYSLSDKTWTRKDAHDNTCIELVKFKDDVVCDKVIEACNKADYVLVNSLPSKGHPPEAIKNFARLLKSLKVPMVLVQLDHMSASIARNECLNEAIDAAKVLFSLSPTNDFGEYVIDYKGVGQLSSFFGDDEVEIFDFQPGCYFDTIRDKYWKDIKEQDSKRHCLPCRTTSWKGYNQMFSFHENYLRAHACLTMLEGIERSPAYLGFKEIGPFEGHIQKDDSPLTVDLSTKYGAELQVFGPYVQADMLERMSKTAFGYQQTIFKQRYLARALEYTHCEVVAVGALPVFREDFGRRCHHRISGLPLTECKDTGTVWLSETHEDMVTAFLLIKKLEKDLKMRDEWRHMAYEFYKGHQDANFTFAEMIATAEAKIAS